MYSLLVLPVLGRACCLLLKGIAREAVKAITDTLLNRSNCIWRRRERLTQAGLL